MGRIAAGLLALVVGLPLLVVVVVVAWFSQALGEQDAGAAPPPGDGIPGAFWPLYVEAGHTFEVSPYLLAAIHKHETGFSTHPDTYRINFVGCCIGPMQMNVRDGTWDAVRDAYRAGGRPTDYPHPAQPHPSPVDSFDAIMAAAKLLRLKAAGRPLLELDQSAWEAARAYAGAGPVAERYADEVLTLARGFAASVGGSSEAGSAKLGWPVPRDTPVTSPFCARRAWEACHPGVDLGVPAGTVVRAAADGIVTIANWVSGYGRFVCVRHAARLGTCYAHLSRIDVVGGAAVERGQVIGLSGCTGLCFGAHLHFEVRLGGGPPAPVVDPMRWLRWVRDQVGGEGGARLARRVP